MAAIKQSTRLSIDECEEWVWDTPECTGDCGFEYIKDGNKEFLILNTNDFFAEAEALDKIMKTTGIELVHIIDIRNYGLEDMYHSKIPTLGKPVT